MQILHNIPSPYGSRHKPQTQNLFKESPVLEADALVWCFMYGFELQWTKHTSYLPLSLHPTYNGGTGYLQEGKREGLIANLRSFGTSFYFIH